MCFDSKVFDDPMRLSFQLTFSEANNINSAINNNTKLYAILQK